MSDGNAAYKTHDYTDAVTDFTAAASQLTGVEQAKAYYKLGLSYHKEGDSSDAATAFLHAQSIDPTLSFASSPDKFRHMLAEVQGVGSGATTPLTSTSAVGTTDPVANALTAQTVYVDPSMLSAVNSTTLAGAAESDVNSADMAGCPLAGVIPESKTLVKIAIVNKIPPTARSAGEYASELHKYLNLGSNAVIVVGEHLSDGSPGGVGISTGSLSDVAQDALAAKYTSQIGSGDITGGVSALAGATAGAIDAKERIGPEIMSTVILVVIIVVLVMLYSATRRKKARLESLRVPLMTLKENVLQNIQYIDNYSDVLPKNNADTDQVRAYRQAAEAKYEQAEKIINKATDESELYRAQTTLDKANADLTRARQYLDKATGGASAIPGDEAVRPAGIPATTAEAQQVPHEQRGVSFFSSQPAPLSGLVPVSLNIDGSTRTVMATPEEAEQIRLGQIPPVRAFNDGGRMVPWYSFQNYDPYRDYYHYQNNGWGGFGSGAVAGFIGAELMDSLLRPNYYGGWNSPYGYSPGFDGFGGWNNYNYGSGYDQGFFNGEQNANQFAFLDQYNQPPQDNYGGSSFMGSGYDTSDYGNSGGSSFVGGGGDNS
jgi:hypothetical protein